MNYRKFGKTDLVISEVGFGAWAIGGAADVGGTAIGWGEADDATSAAAIYAALNAGINFFDTADFYGLGHSEQLIGDALKNNKEAIIATKVGHRNVDDSIVLDYSKKYILEACEASLKRLKREVIDYYQLHSARINHLQQGDCIEAMEQLKQEGKIRYWGLSLNTFQPAPEANFLMERKLGDGFQLVFNLINQRAWPIIEDAAKNEYGVIARMPLQFGLLTGKFSSDSKFSKNDHRSQRLTKDILFNSHLMLEGNVWPVAVKENLSATALALSFILSHPQISTVIPGIRTPEQVKGNTTGIKQLQADNLLFLKGLSSQWEQGVKLMEKQG